MNRIRPVKPLGSGSCMAMHGQERGWSLLNIGVWGCELLGLHYPPNSGTFVQRGRLSRTPLSEVTVNLAHRMPGPSSALPLLGTSLKPESQVAPGMASCPRPRALGVVLIYGATGPGLVFSFVTLSAACVAALPSSAKLCCIPLTFRGPIQQGLSIEVEGGKLSPMLGSLQPSMAATPTLAP